MDFFDFKEGGGGFSMTFWLREERRGRGEGRKVLTCQVCHDVEGSYRIGQETSRFLRRFEMYTTTPDDFENASLSS